MDDRLLGEGRVEVADGRAVAGSGQAIDPGVEDAVVLVVVAFEVIDRQGLARRKAPEVPFPIWGWQLRSPATFQ
jgi:hypothetical protein